MYACDNWCDAQGGPAGERFEAGIPNSFLIILDGTWSVPTRSGCVPWPGRRPGCGPRSPACGGSWPPPRGQAPAPPVRLTSVTRRAHAPGHQRRWRHHRGQGHQRGRAVTDRAGIGTAVVAHGNALLAIRDWPVMAQNDLRRPGELLTRCGVVSASWISAVRWRSCRWQSELTNPVVRAHERTRR